MDYLSYCRNLCHGLLDNMLGHKFGMGKRIQGNLFRCGAELRSTSEPSGEGGNNSSLSALRKSHKEAMIRTS